MSGDCGSLTNAKRVRKHFGKCWTAEPRALRERVPLAQSPGPARCERERAARRGKVRSFRRRCSACREVEGIGGTCLGFNAERLRRRIDLEMRPRAGKGDGEREPVPIDSRSGGLKAGVAVIQTPGAERGTLEREITRGRGEFAGWQVVSEHIPVTGRDGKPNIPGTCHIAAKPRVPSAASGERFPGRTDLEL